MASEIAKRRVKKRKNAVSFLVTLGTVAALSAGPALADDEPDEDWHGKLNLGVAVAVGNFDSFTGTVTGEAKKAWDLNELNLDLLLAYGITTINDDNKGDGITDTDSTTSDIQRLQLGYKRFLDDVIADRFYWYLDGEVGRNNVQDIQYYGLVNTGPGWRIWQVDDPKKNFWDLEAGIGYRYDNYQLPSRADSLEDRSLINGRISTEARRAFEVVEVGVGAAVYLPFNLPEAWFADGNAFLNVPLSESWTLTNSVVVSYLNQPPDSAEKIAALLTISLGYTF